MNQDFYARILKGYQEDPCWKRIARQLDNNYLLGEDAVYLPFTRARHLPATDADPYFSPRPVDDFIDNETPKDTTQKSGVDKRALGELIFYVDRITKVQRLCIPLNVVKEVFAIAYSNGHPGF